MLLEVTSADSLRSLGASVRTLAIAPNSGKKIVLPLIHVEAMALLSSLLRAQGSFSGRVIDERSGKPLANVSTGLFSLYNPKKAMDTVTGTDGQL